MQKVLATIHNLGMNSSHTKLSTGELGDSERSLVFAIETWRFNLFARGKCRQRLEAEIDTDLPDSMSLVFGDLNLDIEIPAAASVLSEAPGPNLSDDGPTEPQPVPAPEKDHSIAFYADRARSLEWDPRQTLLAPPARPLAACIARNSKLFADRLHGVRVQTKKFAATRGEPDQIETGGPVLVVAPSGLLNLSAVVPDSVHCLGLADKIPPRGRILDSVAVSQHHANMLVERCSENKTDAKQSAEIFTLDFTSATSRVENAIVRRFTGCFAPTRGESMLRCLSLVTRMNFERLLLSCAMRFAARRV